VVPDVVNNRDNESITVDISTELLAAATIFHAYPQRDVRARISACDCIPEDAIVSQQLPGHSYRAPESFSGQIATLDHGVDL
jgi:hypothetical protein